MNKLHFEIDTINNRLKNLQPDKNNFTKRFENSNK